MSIYIIRFIEGIKANDNCVKKLSKVCYKRFYNGESDKSTIPYVFKCLFLLIREQIDKTYHDIAMQEKEAIIANLENLLMNKVHQLIFPTEQTEYDVEYADRLSCLQWISPSSLEIKQEDMGHDMWEIPIMELSKIDDCTSPNEKMSLIQQSYQLIAEILNKFSARKEAPGAEDTFPLFCYILLKACPQYMNSTLQYADY
jgi:hypothetical protein